MIGQRAHHVTVAAEDQERDEREGDAEGEHDLADDQRTAGVEANGEEYPLGESLARAIFVQRIAKPT